jgi:pimeloyl-ACP methyl ester carboxylesterase
VKADEGFIEVPGGRVWYRSVGESRQERAPSEFTVTGTLKTWDIMDRLGEIEVPALLVGGRCDECTPSHLAAMHQRIRGSQLRIIEDASHLCFAEQPAEFATIVNSFFDLTDRGSSL